MASPGVKKTNMIQYSSDKEYLIKFSAIRSMAVLTQGHLNRGVLNRAVNLIDLLSPIIFQPH